MTLHRRPALILAVLLPLAAALGPGPAAASLDRPRPLTLSLPAGFQPEGIAIGRGPFAYFGSRADGRIWRADLDGGPGNELSPPVGTASLGLKLDARGRLFVAGGGGGDARVIDTRSGAVLAHYPFTTGDTFVNDVTLLGGVAYFTDSRKAVLYTLRIGHHGELPASFTPLALTGDLVLTPGVNNLNGIAATPDGRALIAVQSNTGLLLRIDPATGVTTRLDTGGRTFVNGDGLWLDGHTLYVVQNRDNTVVALRLDRAGTAGTVRATRTDPRFDGPTTIAQDGHRLYLPNARFTTTPAPDTAYSAQAIPAF